MKLHSSRNKKGGGATKPFAALKKNAGKAVAAKKTSSSSSAKTSDKGGKKRVWDEKPAEDAANVRDAWDTGATERTEEAQARKKAKTKKLRFEPAPATFALPSREEQLRKQMGDFAGPLLGTLWEEETKGQQVQFVDRKDKGKWVGGEEEQSNSPVKRRKGNENQFAALESDEEADASQTRESSSSGRKVAFKPSTLGDVTGKSLSLPSDASALVSKGAPLFKPPTIDADQLRKLPPNGGSSSLSGLQVQFRPPTFSINPVPPTLVARSGPSQVLFQPPTFQINSSSSSAATKREDEDWDDL